MACAGALDPRSDLNAKEIFGSDDWINLAKLSDSFYKIILSPYISWLLCRHKFLKP